MDYLDTKGRVFDVQRYSIHDGPGIRTIVQMVLQSGISGI